MYREQTLITAAKFSVTAAPYVLKLCQLPLPPALHLYLSALQSHALHHWYIDVSYLLQEGNDDLHQFLFCAAVAVGTTARMAMILPKWMA